MGVFVLAGVFDLLAHDELLGLLMAVGLVVGVHQLDEYLKFVASAAVAWAAVLLQHLLESELVDLAGPFEKPAQEVVGLDACLRFVEAVQVVQVQASWALVD